MEKGSYECDSVDLTEDEDSRETIADDFASSSYLPPAMQTMTVIPTNPPPLTPIRQFTNFQNKNLSGQQVMNVPKLKKIRRPSTVPQLLKAPQPSTHTNLETVCLDSDDEERRPVSCDNYTTGSPSKISGKIVIIKKNNKYYRIVIPHNVMPTINQNEGPVLINIPGVGPLVIKIDPKAKEQTVTKNDQLQPFSLNFDEIMDSVSNQANLPTSSQTIQPQSTRRERTNKSQEKQKVEDLLSDTRFCWNLSKARFKNTHYALLYRDYVGFSKVDSFKSRKCCSALENYLNKKRMELEQAVKMYEHFKIRMRRDNNIKPVRISEIVGESVNQVYVQRLNSNVAIGNEKTYIPEPLKSYEFQNAQLPPNTVVTQIDYNDLLLTTKVVILNEQKGTGRKLKSRSRKRLNNKKRCFTPKPCYVQIIRDKNIEQIHKNREEPKINGKIHSSHGKLQTKEDLSPIKNVWTIFRKYTIESSRKFQQQMSYIKPLLILNEFNFNIVEYPVEFGKSNIIYSVNKQFSFPKAILSSQAFVSAVASGYVKLVDEEVLCNFIQGQFGPKSSSMVG